jgi:hypothetical protein
LAPLNLTLLQRRFNTVQQWAIAEVLLAEGLIRRVQCAKRLIKLAASAKTCRDLLTLFAVTLGLSAPPISRLHRQLWLAY